MKVANTLALLAIFTQASHAASLPDAANVVAEYTISRRAPHMLQPLAPDHSLERRKGGGGGGGRGGGGSSSSGGSRGGSSSSSGGSSGSSARTGSSSSSGGSTSRGSGPTRSYGGGYYGGGAVVPYTAGSRSAKGLLAGALILPAALLLLMPGLWLWSVYPYMYPGPVTFLNQTAANTSFPDGVNTTLSVLCLCQQFSVCGCDDNNDPQYIKDLVGNGSYAALNKSLVNVATYKDKTTLILNGTLPNGTTAPGGSDSGASSVGLGSLAGYWAMGLVVLYGIFL